MPDRVFGIRGNWINNCFGLAKLGLDSVRLFFCFLFSLLVSVCFIYTYVYFSFYLGSAHGEDVAVLDFCGYILRVLCKRHVMISGR